MLYVELGERKVPALGFGTWQIRGSACRDAVEDALAIGYRHIDTAAAYENEEEVGAGLHASAVPREEVFLVTKVPRERLDEQEVRRSAEESLRRLRTDYVDLLLVHWPNPEIPLEETLHAMMRLADDGKVRFLGVSNFPSDLWRKACRIAPVVCNQVEYHPFLEQGAVLEAVRVRGAMLAAYSPLARGRVTDDPVLRRIGEAHGKNPVQVTLRWLVQQDRVSAVPKASSPEHRRSNFEIFDFELSDDEMRAIHDLARPDGRRIDPSWAPEWDREPATQP